MEKKTDDNTTNKPLLLLTSNFNANKIGEIIEKTRPVIVTFDYESHKLLTEKNIDHKTSDSYLHKDEIKKIQDLSYMYSRWYESSKVSTILEHERINTGKLFYVEFHYFLLPFLKKVVELLNLEKLYGHSQFIVSSDLYGIAKNIHQLTLPLDENKTDDTFLYDSLTINLTESFKIKISKKQYQKIKYVSERLFTKLLNTKASEKTKKYMLVEFDPIKYENFLINSKDYDLDFVLFNRRRPAIWNSQSLKILKKSNCIIPPEFEILNDLKKKSNSINQIIDEKLGFLFDNEDYFQSFFTINNFSLWKILKPIFIKLCKERISQAIKEIEVANRMFKKHKFSGILVWSESGFNEQITIGLAKNYRVPVFLLQHGLCIDELKATDYNKFSGILPILSDKFVVWGDVIAKYASACEIPNNKIEIAGSVVYDKLFQKHNSKNDDFVLFALTAPRKVNISGLLNSTIANYENAIKKVCSVVLNNNKKLIVKLHPFPEELDVTKLIKKIDPSIRVVHSGNILSLLESCELFLSMGISTAILEAQIIGKPVISIYADYDFGDPYVLRTNSCFVTTINNFEENFKKIIADESLRKKIILSGQQSVKDNFSNGGNASKKLLALLEKFV